jgi:DinB superfamily
MADTFSIAAAGRALDGAISRFVHGLTSAPIRPGEERARALARYRAIREGTLAIIRELTQAQADFSPGANVWSIGQNVQHLLLTEDLYRTQMREMIEMARKGGANNIDLTFQQINTTFAYIPREVMPLFSVPLNIMNIFMPRIVRETMFRLPVIPAVNPTFSSPAGSVPVEELRARASSSIEATEAIFKGDLPANLNDITLSHPILGTNNIPQIFGVIAAHEERHHTQMRSVVANPRFPR